jgi:mercuric ion transport protein
MDRSVETSRKRFVESAATRPAEPKRKLAGASIGAAIVAAFASSLCCIGPLVLAALGLGGAGLLVKLEASRPYLAALTVGLLGAGFYLTYRRPRPAGPNASGSPACDCAVPTAHRFGRVALWVATVVVAVFLAFPYLAGILFG